MDTLLLGLFSPLALLFDKLLTRIKCISRGRRHEAEPFTFAGEVLDHTSPFQSQWLLVSWIGSTE